MASTVTTDYVKGTIKIEINYDKEITNIILNGEEIPIPEKQNGKYVIEKEIQNNGTYHVIAKDGEGKFNLAGLNVSDITEDMDIYTKEDMIAFRDKVNSGRTFAGRTVRVMNDIDLQGSQTNQWGPIGSNGVRFAGTFEGNFHTIENLYTNTTNDYQALFSYNNGTIKNVNLGNGNVIGNNCAAGLVSINEGKVIRCSNLLTAVTAKNTAAAGGVVARNTNLVEECCNKATVTAQGSSSEMMIGGVVGENTKSLYSSYNAGEIIATMTGESENINVGGVVGYIQGSNGVAEGLYNTGKVTAKKTTGASKVVRVGGVCGTIFPQNATLTYAYNLGTVSGTSSTQVFLGDVLGDADGGTARYLYSNGKTVIGRAIDNNPIVSNCYTTIPRNIDSKYFTSDDNEINNGFPILKWQAE